MKRNDVEGQVRNTNIKVQYWNRITFTQEWITNVQRYYITFKNKISAKEI